MMSVYDQNKDGRLTKEEMKKMAIDIMEGKITEWQIE